MPSPLVISRLLCQTNVRSGLNPEDSMKNIARRRIQDSGIGVRSLSSRRRIGQDNGDNKNTVSGGRFGLGDCAPTLVRRRQRLGATTRHAACSSQGRRHRTVRSHPAHPHRATRSGGASQRGQRRLYGEQADDDYCEELEQLFHSLSIV